jgi:hypothetical protein
LQFAQFARSRAWLLGGEHGAGPFRLARCRCKRRPQISG